MYILTLSIPVEFIPVYLAKLIKCLQAGPTDVAIVKLFICLFIYLSNIYQEATKDQDIRNKHKKLCLQ